MAGLKDSQHLTLSFKEIQVATRNFKTCIGKGGYGHVYIGELFTQEKVTMVAAKKLNEQFGQGLKEFLTEIQLLTGQEHPNLVSLIGCCDDAKEKIIVYEYAERGSLDRYLRRNNPIYILTWLQRLKICADAARGLDHLHRHVGKHQSIIHRDIKSANILIDKNWVAKISDLGLSKLCLAGLGRSVVVSHVCGTLGYVDPQYISTGTLTKESDVYSFGMVLFEVFCGRLCGRVYNDGFCLYAKLIKDCYQKNKLDEIIDPCIKEQLSSYSLSKFATLAYKCLEDDREERPTMEFVTKELEEILKIQMEYESGKKKKSKSRISTIVESESDEYWMMKLPDDSEDIIKLLNPSGHYSTAKELFKHLHKGFFFDNGERFFSINDDGRKCEMISAKGFIDHKSKSPRQTPFSPQLHRKDDSTRFQVIGRYPHTTELNIHCHISTSMLSLDTLYSVNLVFSFEEWDDSGSLHLGSSRWVWIKWKCEQLCVSSAHLAVKRRDDRNFRSTLWHFKNCDKNAYFDIVINRLLGGEEEKLPYIIIHGLEFQPVETKKPRDGIDAHESSSASKEYADWGKKSPFDYLGIIHRSNMHWEYTTEKELYFLLCDGILIDNDRKWFFLCKSTGDKCHMLQAIEIFRKDSNYELMDTIPLSESRFKVGIQLQNALQYYFTCKLESDMFSSHKPYACYLVFKFVNDYTTPDDGCLLESYCGVNEMKTSTIFAHLNSREPIPEIKPKKKNTKFNHELWTIPKTKGFGVPKYCFNGTHNWLQKRNDGWMEVMLCHPFHDLEKGDSMNVKLQSIKGSFCGIIVQGIEFRPMERDF